MRMVAHNQIGALLNQPVGLRPLPRVRQFLILIAPVNRDYDQVRSLSGRTQIPVNSVDGIRWTRPSAAGITVTEIIANVASPTLANCGEFSKSTGTSDSCSSSLRVCSRPALPRSPA